MTKSVMSLELKIQYQCWRSNTLPVSTGFHWLHSTDAFSVVPHLIPKLGQNSLSGHSLLWCYNSLREKWTSSAETETSSFADRTEVGESCCPEIRSRQLVSRCRKGSNSLRRGLCPWPSFLAWTLHENGCLLQLSKQWWKQAGAERDVQVKYTSLDFTPIVSVLVGAGYSFTAMWKYHL